jgi:serine/threonine protein kinase
MRAGTDRPPLESLQSIALQIAAGLATAHGAGIVHGDLKPENVMVTADGLVKVLDFGLARRLRRSQPIVTDDTEELGLAELGGGLFGTPRYLTPEQVRGEPASQASDIFSLGVMFYELATGKPAFPANHLLQILDQIRSVEPEMLASETPEPFAALLCQLLIVEADQRRITMREVAETLLAASESPAALYPIEFPQAIV